MSNPLLLERGRAALLAGNFVGASSAFEESLQQDPNHAECWFLLGAVHHQTQKLVLARTAFSKAGTLDPLHLQCRFALATVCLDLGDGKAAVSACLEATELAANDPQAWFSLGAAHEACNAHKEALAAYEHALLLVPDHPGALKNRRALLITIGRFDEAIKQCRSLVAKRPFSLEAQFNLGESLTAAQNFAEATRVFARAANLSPQNARVALHYGFALAQLERFSEAQKQLDHAARLDPALLSEYRQSIFGKEHGDAATAPPRLGARALFLLRHFDRIERCDWTERDHFINRFSELVSETSGPALTERALGFRALAMGLDPALQLALARQITSGVETLLPEGIQQPFHSSPIENRLPRIRIGYLSADFRYHPVGLLLGDMFSWHDRCRFEVYGYSIGNNDGSEQRRKIVSGCDLFTDLAGLDDDTAAHRIASDSIDVLVDLTGYQDQARPGIVARRPARVQVSWMDYLTTRGAPWIDYVIADAVSLPEKLARHFSEAAIRLPVGIYLCAYADRQLSAPPHRCSVGLPNEGIVLGAMHNPYKIDPQVFTVWMGLLKANENAVLWLLEGHPEATSALRSAARQHGVTPERLVFAPKAPHDEHLARLQLVDLALDTLQCSGGTTTADTLVAGVPMLTCAGPTLIQRAAASLLHAAAQDDLITYDLAQYETLAHVLLADPDRLRALRQRIVEAKSAAIFFHPKKWMCHFEAGIIRAWERHCTGVPPQAIKVE